MKMVSTFLVLMVVLAGCGPKTVAKVTVGPNPSPPLAISKPEKNARRAIVTVIPVQPLTIAPRLERGQRGMDPVVQPKTIKVSISEEHFWAYEGGKLVYQGPVSAALGPTVPVGEMGDKAHNHVGSWYVFSKETLHHSRAYDCDMRNCLFYCDGHAIHACQQRDIGKLGREASHGCIRVHPNMAKKLFAWADIGTRVIVSK